MMNCLYSNKNLIALILGYVIPNRIKEELNESDKIPSQ